MKKLLFLGIFLLFNCTAMEEVTDQEAAKEPNRENLEEQVAELEQEFCKLESFESNMVLTEFTEDLSEALETLNLIEDMVSSLPTADAIKKTHDKVSVRFDRLEDQLNKIDRALLQFKRNQTESEQKSDSCQC